MSKNNYSKLIGFIGQNPEVRSEKVITFSLSTSNNYKDKSGEWQSNTTWHNCVVFDSGYTAQAFKTIENAVKGSYMMLEGEIVSNEYTDKEGKKRESKQLKVEQAYFLMKQARTEETKINQPVSITDSFDDTPF